MNRLFLAFAILAQTLVFADPGGHFVWPASDNGNGSQISTLYEGTTVVVQWETTYKFVGLWLTQEGNPTSLPFPDSQAVDHFVHLFPWVVDISKEKGNPAFELSKGNKFHFSIVQNGSTADAAGSFQSVSFYISNTSHGTSSLTTSSSDSNSSSGDSTTSSDGSESTTSTPSKGNSASSLMQSDNKAWTGMALGLVAMRVL
ncbi:hypothetical protein FE257_007393 [Aspergillus nanangensis]|uniref:Ser-Thr-rich glycosyl-phosphatidyl-inositol-anchored membrane family-domain-containing protein n=1 Tax=Aspergillus nanangensis TaxID=2582783 RepID=A0AAD4GU48_ASPNN|nr:hypothetical protein FE257_007393 [Aspergillus nanangensis]